LSSVPSLISSWIERKLSWKWVYSPTQKPLVIPAGKEIRIRRHDHPEGVLTHALGVFDSPACGVRLRAEPTLDTMRTQTISTVLQGGGYRTNMVAWVSIPPTTPPGIYIMNYVREVPWTNFVEFWVYNTDSVPHRLILGGYVLAVLLSERDEPADEALLDLIKKQQGMGG